MSADNRTCTTYFCSSVWIHQSQFGPIHTVTFGYQDKLQKMNLASFSCSTHLMYITNISSMDATHYWPFAREYSIWNAAVAALQFWTEDLEPHILSDALERVYTAFFCSNSAQQLRNISEEVLFSHLVITLNNAFKRELTQEDKGYESGSKSFSIPTSLRRASRICHVSTSESISFNLTTPLTTAAQHPDHTPRSCSCVCCHLTFSNDESPSTDSSHLHGRAEQSSPVQQHMVYHCTDDSFQDATNEEEEDFPTAPLNDDIWLEEPVPVRHLCIHEQSQPNFLCSYPCPFSFDLPILTHEDTPASYHNMTDLNDISDFKDVMTTTSGEDIPNLDDVFGL